VQHASKDVNVQLKREADFYRDIVIVPFLDRYELLVLKTIAICEYAVRILHFMLLPPSYQLFHFSCVIIILIFIAVKNMHISKIQFRSI
jgi:hypothetical protein